MERFSVEAVVIGAGVVGLGAAAALARDGWETILIEATEGIGSGISSRNSEVIHAGVYYPPGSLKARLCVEGRDRLYAYARERGVPHLNCGKLIVATTPREAEALRAIFKRAEANGAGLSEIDGAEARRLEPGLSPEVSSALYSPRTGIVDSHALMVALQGEFEDAGGAIAFGAPVVGGTAADGALEIATGGAAPARIGARFVVNAAGLAA
ncbi:MAG: FAD-dependent oxidoreductase, partial [Parvularculaceae bacterium]|nr:FAD-dependent oxidoreductase [Parvularculaceae bacterium]